MSAISSQTTEALRQAAQLVERDQALAALVGVLDPDRTQSLHGLAGVVCRMLETHSTGLARILAGARPPRDEIEVALVTLYRVGCPASQRQLYRLLGDLLG